MNPLEAKESGGKLLPRSVLRGESVSRVGIMQQEKVAGACEYGNELSSYIKIGGGRHLHLLYPLPNPPFTPMVVTFICVYASCSRVI
jgi:hypothetical protein